MLLALPPELINIISELLPLEGCYSLMQVCSRMYHVIIEHEDKLQARHIDRLAYDDDYYFRVITGGDGKGPPIWVILDGMMTDPDLKKGREWIIKNNPTWFHNYFLKWYCETSNLEMVKKLLADKRIDPDDDGESGYSARNVAMIHGSQEVKEMLKE